MRSDKLMIVYFSFLASLAVLTSLAVLFAMPPQQLYVMGSEQPPQPEPLQMEIEFTAYMSNTTISIPSESLSSVSSSSYITVNFLNITIYMDNVTINFFDEFTVLVEEGTLHILLIDNTLTITFQGTAVAEDGTVITHFRLRLSPP